MNSVQNAEYIVKKTGDDGKLKIQIYYHKREGTLTIIAHDGWCILNTDFVDALRPDVEPSSVKKIVLLSSDMNTNRLFSESNFFNDFVNVTEVYSELGYMYHKTDEIHYEAYTTAYTKAFPSLRKLTLPGKFFMKKSDPWGIIMKNLRELQSSSLEVLNFTTKPPFIARDFFEDEEFSIPSLKVLHITLSENAPELNVPDFIEDLDLERGWNLRTLYLHSDEPREYGTYQIFSDFLPVSLVELYSTEIIGASDFPENMKMFNGLRHGVLEVTSVSDITQFNEIKCCFIAFSKQEVASKVRKLKIFDGFPVDFFYSEKHQKHVMYIGDRGEDVNKIFHHSRAKW